MVLFKEQFDDMETFVECTRGVAHRCVRDFTSRCSRRSDCKNDIEDLTQEAIVALIRAWYRLREVGQITTSVIYQDVFHSLYSYVVGNYGVRIPRNIFKKMKDNFSISSYDGAENITTWESVMSVAFEEDPNLAIDLSLFRSQLDLREQKVFDCLLRGIPHFIIADDFLHCSRSTVTRIQDRIKQKLQWYFEDYFDKDA